MPSEHFDYVVIGSGSAGGVVAARLTEDPSVSVLLLEAGPEDDDDMIHLPAGFSALFKTKWDWGYQTTPQKQLGGRRADWPRMKALGGCTSMNAMIYIRGNRADYDEWRDAYGADGWGYDDVLPYFIKAEGNTRLGGPYPRHRRPAARRGSPLHPRADPCVRRLGRRRRVQAHRRLQRCRAGGCRALPGHLQEGPPLVGGRRVHPSRTATAPTSRSAPTPSSQRIEMDGNRATGVTYRRGGVSRDRHRRRRGRSCRPARSAARRSSCCRASARAPTCARWASTSASTRPASARTSRTIR